MCCDGLNFFLAVVFRLQWVPLWVDCRVGVLNGNVMARDQIDIGVDLCGGLHRMCQRISLRPLPQHCTLHLVEDRVVATVNRITTIDIGDHGIPDLLWARLLIAVDLLEICLLVCASMCAQYRLVVDVVGIRPAATRVVRRETENVKVLRSCDNGVLFKVVAEYWRWELALNEFAGNGEGVVLVEVEASTDVREDRVWSVGPLVGGIGISFNLEVGLRFWCLVGLFSAVVLASRVESCGRAPVSSDSWN